MRLPFVLAATASTMLAAGAALAAEVPFSSKQTVQGGLSGAGVAVAADLDRDGDLDVLGCTEGTATGVGWWQNAAGDGSTWIQELFDADFDCRQVVAADLDGDGDLDAVGAAFGGGSGITWWENDLGGTATWIEHGIDTKFSGSLALRSATSIRTAISTWSPAAKRA